ncbi:peptidoglycan DD-metalloendopeptidase family protein [Franzmannia qiaohouensis]|uniref:Peptidoglycan DD-metalloendopeptidase family protein n=1 Tax=Franzmannia qiaohouensis TaxID=1329370 RepID=A0ABU1HJ05_9GAMM|nr:peptidoglycan DD-metalloendopeptidase family protein [Halomonas qiaohouensis]MDR5907460.1 peptidoglycan DD-metalloendopeptidase family protein [Halomonas qiaohouensis]
MLRILHSLPRTHKLLLLPVATMVTVLGTQKIIGAFDSSSESPVAASPIHIPLDSNTNRATDAPDFEHSAVSEAVEMASSALDATRQYVPIAELAAQEIVDIDVLSTAHASDEQMPVVALAPEPDDEQQQNDSPATIDTDVLHLALHLPELGQTDDLEQIGDSLEDTGFDDEAMASYTSYDYDDYLDGPLVLFDDGDVFLDEELVAEQAYVPEWETYTVQQGDTFAVMAQQTLGLGYSEVLQLLDKMPDRNVLTRWRAGHNFDYQLDEDGQLLALRVMKNPRSGFLIERDPETAFEISSIEKAGEPTQRMFAGTVSGSFGRSAEATGLSASEVAQLSNLLEKKLDFRRDTRRGDRFQVLVESDLIDGQSLDSRVLAVKYEGARMDLTVIRNSSDNRFYTPEGYSLDPAFDRYPFDGNYRMSSSFNLRRKHPVTGRVSPHYGTDWAMPIGTSIHAPADGRVEKVGNHPLAGRFIVVRHDNGYRTRYLHLSQPLVSRGDRVSMGETIAKSGNTGRSTGPHLHYEVIVNGNQVDPMRVDLPENQSLEGDALAAFQRESERLLATLESGETGTVIASTSAGEPEPRRPGDDS